MAVLADPKLKFPFYFPRVSRAAPRTPREGPRIYTLKDETGKKRQAYRLVLRAPGVGEYVGVQGMTWKAPPILDNPDRTVRSGGRKLRLYYDGRNLRIVAWKTKNGASTGSPTRSRSASARTRCWRSPASLRRLKQ